MTLSVNNALTAGTLAAQINSTTASIAVLQTAIANGWLVNDFSIRPPNSTNVTQLLTIPLDAPTSLAAMQAALPVFQNILTGLQAALAAVPYA